ncbi:MAG: hypothetical protein KA712_05140 [Myxococcales bacterium]|nr:hypothetical protein [Myxococcales bacterium]
MRSVTARGFAVHARPPFTLAGFCALSLTLLLCPWRSASARSEGGSAATSPGRLDPGPQGGILRVVNRAAAPTSHFAPLDSGLLYVSGQTAGLRVEVRDSRRSLYFTGPAEHEVPFEVRGALGEHEATLLRGPSVVATAPFTVLGNTDLSCSDASITNELRRLSAQLRGYGRAVFVDGKVVHTFAPTLRGNRYAAAAARYLTDDLTSLPDLFLERQKGSGLVFSGMRPDNHYDPFSGTYPGVDIARDTFGDAYTDRSKDGRWVFERVPSEADVEAMATSWVHEVWQATGDDAWMKSKLPVLEKALGYVQQDPLRWSSETGLVQRGFTLDVWNFQHPLVIDIHPRGSVNRAGWFDGLWLDADSPKGIAHGDNTAMFEAAMAMARMHAHAGDEAQALAWIQWAERLRESLEKQAWTGSFFRHFVRLTEDERWKSLEVDEAVQLSLSNPFAITRGAATHAQAVAIVAEYQRRYERTKGQVLAEWSTMDPPFPKSFGPFGPGSKGNGAISPIVAGPLAQAALEHGAEAYGADVLRRVLALQAKHGRLHDFYFPSSRSPGWLAESFFTIDLRTVANRHLRGDRTGGFIDHPDNDLRSFPVGKQTFLGKPFDVIDPKDNGGRAAVVLWGAGSPGPRETTVAGINRKANSIYFLHSAGNIGGQARVGEYEVNYEDGTKVRIPLVVGRNIASWWADGDAGEWRLAWRGKNPHVSVIGVGVWGWDNKQPDKVIESITMRASGGGRVQLLGITLSTAPVQFERGEVEGGGAEPWAAGVVYRAAVEGLAGVSDKAHSFTHVRVAPRWLAVGQPRARVLLRYPSSLAYVAYEFSHLSGARTLQMTFSGSGKRFDFHVLLPSGHKPRRVTLDGRKLRYRTEVVEASAYADFVIEEQSAGRVEISY